MLSSVSKEYGWPDYLLVISTVEQGTDSGASGLWRWVWSTYSQVHWCSGQGVVALHTALTDTERIWQQGFLYSISILHVCFAAVASVTSTSFQAAWLSLVHQKGQSSSTSLLQVLWLGERKKGEARKKHTCQIVVHGVQGFSTLPGCLRPQNTIQ